MRLPLGRSILNAMFAARPGVLVAILLFVIADTVLLVLSYGPLRLGNWRTPVLLTTSEVIEAAVAVGTLSLAYAAMVQAESAERQRRFATFPEIRLALRDRMSQDLLPIEYGRTFVLPSIDAVAVENTGNGPAFGLNLVASWKLFDIERLKVATAAELDQSLWSLVPDLPSVEGTLQAHSTAAVNLTGPVHHLIEGQRFVRRAFAIHLRLSYLDPDGRQGDVAQGGVRLVPGSFTTGRGPWGEVETAHWVVLHPEEYPPD